MDNGLNKGRIYFIFVSHINKEIFVLFNCILFFQVSTGTSKLMILTKDFQNEKPDFPTTPYPTEERSAALTVAALSK